MAAVDDTRFQSRGSEKKSCSPWYLNLGTPKPLSHPLVYQKIQNLYDT